MASIREENLQKRLENYYAAEEAILSSQEYSINGRSLKRADLGTVQKTIKELEMQLESLSGRRRISYGIPRG
ncbi:hypothetical protein M4D71_23560 [Niallia taxi]|uniref:hypothetical protein n=1 Tax=Niallia taxi TaxID=2499688 RepID=UPI0021A8660C|nr:hypothetical protein [Niallia taxi]MCT2347132.1 hypothetical protein [Niallia taxi]